MKILILSDCHLRDTNPRNRQDNYYQTGLDKLDWCFNLAKINKCNFVLQAGDLTDNPRSSYRLIAAILGLLHKHDIKVYGVTGQHDRRHHTNDLSNVPITVLQTNFNKFELLNKEPICTNNLNIYGSSFGEEIPKILDQDKFNILVTHRMVIGEDKLWEGQESYVTARTLLAKNKFNLIVSGDNHQFFTSEYQGRHLLNLGSLLRSTSAQIDHKPKVAIFDTDKNNYELFDVPIQPASAVFNLDEIKNKKEEVLETDKIKEYISLLSNKDEKTTYDYVNNLNNFMEQNQTSKVVKEIVVSTLKDKKED